MENRPVLAVSGLSVVRGSTTLLQDVDWRVRKSQHWVILGLNGSGKTSLLRVLAGYLAPSRGTIQVFGRTYGQTDWRELRERIGIVSSSLQLSIPLAETVLETVISGKFAQLDLWATIKRSDRAAGMKMLSRVGLEPLADREWVHLSQGEKQRALIARALMGKPELLILDEPCSGLDPVAREHFLGFVERLARQPGCPALVLVTHHVEEVTPVFTHALLLRNGRVVAAGARRSTLTGHGLSEAFGVSVKLIRRHGKLHLFLPHLRHGSHNPTV